MTRRTALWVLAAARALGAHPRLNATCTPEGILLHKAVHAGVVLDLEDGIVVPVIRDAGRKSLDAIVAELGDRKECARTRRLRGEHLLGATFTLVDWSDAEVRGGLPLLHPPQVALLGIGAPRDLPCLRDGSLVWLATCEVVLVADQRALDAAHAAAFLATLKSEIEGDAAFKHIGLNHGDTKTRRGTEAT